MPKVCFCIPTIVEPYPEMLDALERSIPLVKAAGWEEMSAWEVGHAYVSYARALLLRKALNWGTDWIVFLDHDLAWRPAALLDLLNTKGDVVAGTYRLKSPKEEYMGRLAMKPDGTPKQIRSDGCLLFNLVPAGFLKISANAVEQFMERHPQLDFSRPGEATQNHFDLFNHGVIDKVWWGEDYAFSLRWRSMGNPIWVIPNLDFWHYGTKPGGTRKCYPGNYHKWLLAQPDELVAESVDVHPGSEEAPLPPKNSKDRGTFDVKPELEPHVPEAKENVYADETTRYIPGSI